MAGSHNSITWPDASVEPRARLEAVVNIDLAISLVADAARPLNLLADSCRLRRTPPPWMPVHRRNSCTGLSTRLSPNSILLLSLTLVFLYVLILLVTTLHTDVSARITSHHASLNSQIALCAHHWSVNRCDADGGE